MIFDRLIQVDKMEALAVAGKGGKVFCLVRSGTLDGWSNMQTVTLDEMLDGCMFFAGESNLMADAGPAGGNPTISPGEGEHQENPDEKPVMEKAKALYKEFSGGADDGHIQPPAAAPVPAGFTPCPVPLDESTDKAPTSAAETEPVTDETEETGKKRPHVSKADPDEWTDEMLAVLGALRYDENGRTNWSWGQLANFFETRTVEAVQGALSIYASRKNELAGIADRFELPKTPDGRKRFKSTPRKPEPA